MPQPKSKEDVHRFLGMVNYLAKFTTNLSTRTEELRKIVHQEGVFEELWKEEIHGRKFDELKESISNEALLGYIQFLKYLVY